MTALVAISCLSAMERRVSDIIQRSRRPATPRGEFRRHLATGPQADDVDIGSIGQSKMQQHFYHMVIYPASHSIEGSKA